MDKAVLLKGYLPEDDVVLPSGAGTVRVRGLSRQEAVEVARGLEQRDEDTLEIRGCARGMIDPVMTEDEVRHWRAVAVAADVQAVARRISSLSNMDDSAGKGPTSRLRRTKG